MNERLMNKTDYKRAEKRARIFGTVGKVFVYIMLTFWAIMVLFPFYYMVLTSLKGQGAYNAEVTPKLYTLAPTLENFRKALLIQQKILPENHPSIASSYNNIGIVYQQQGKYAQAIENYQKSLEIKERCFPENHPYIALSYNNIGLVYAKQEKYAFAQVNFQKALAIFKKTLSEKHPYIALCYYNIGLVHFCRGEYRKAYDYVKKAYEIYRLELGDKHPKTQESLQVLKDTEQKLKESQK